MLKELLPLLRPGDTLGLSIACETPETPGVDGGPPQGARFRVNVLPTLDGEKGAARLALNTPLSITGTAAELDSPEFAATLTRFTASATIARHTIDEAEAAHQGAAAATKKAPAKSSGVLPPHKPKAAAGDKRAAWKDRVKTGTKAAPAAQTATSEPPAAAPADPPPAPEPPKNAQEATPNLM